MKPTIIRYEGTAIYLPHRRSDFATIPGWFFKGSITFCLAISVLQFAFSSPTSLIMGTLLMMLFVFIRGAYDEKEKTEL